MPPDEQQPDRHHDRQDRAPAEKPPRVDRREKRRDQRRKRRITEEQRDRNPRRHGCKPEPRVEAEQHARRGGDTLAALKTMEHRQKVSGEDGEPRGGNVAAELRREPYGEPAFARVAEQREYRRGL